MLIERDYMKAPARSTIKIVVLPPPPRSATQWANILIGILGLALFLFFVSRLI